MLEDLGGNPKRAAILTEFTDYVLGRNALNWKKEKGPDSKKVAADVCKLFNIKVCKSQADKDCKSTWGKTLKHVCNKFMPGGRICMKDHPRVDHV